MEVTLKLFIKNFVLHIFVLTDVYQKYTSDGRYFVIVQTKTFFGLI